MKNKSLLGVVYSAWLLAACTTIPVDERAAIREEINTAVNETIDTLVSSDPEFQQEIDASVGYFVSRVSATKIPLVGAGYGIGMVGRIQWFRRLTGRLCYINQLALLA